LNADIIVATEFIHQNIFAGNTGHLITVKFYANLGLFSQARLILNSLVTPVYRPAPCLTKSARLTSGSVTLLSKFVISQVGIIGVTAHHQI
jgi:hypothetical protein